MAMGTSTRESRAPVAATAVSTKKATISACPNGICENTAGSVMKTSDGPAWGAKPKVKTAGKMAIPASMDTHRSAHMTRVAVAGIFWLAPK
jgi:ADP-ribosylglycohydrolase